MRRSGVGWVVAAGVLGLVVLGSVDAARGYVPSPPYIACFNDGEADLASLEASLSPAGGVSIQAGVPVTFSGSSGSPVTFAMASSAALLSSPDIDSGLGTLEPGSSSYTFTSAKATATPGSLVYWDASFSDAGLKACEGMMPKTYTTAVRTFTVVPPPPTEAEVAAKKKQEEAAAARKKQEEETAARQRREAEEAKVKSSAKGGRALNPAQLLAKALKTCRKQPKKKRAKCEATARNRRPGKTPRDTPPKRRR
jgi:hypothetical protein